MFHFATVQDAIQAWLALDRLIDQKVAPVFAHIGSKYLRYLRNMAQNFCVNKIQHQYSTLLDSVKEILWVSVQTVAYFLACSIFSQFQKIKSSFYVCLEILKISGNHIVSWDNTDLPENILRHTTKLMNVSQRMVVAYVRCCRTKNSPKKVELSRNVVIFHVFVIGITRSIKFNFGTTRRRYHSLKKFQKN